MGVGCQKLNVSLDVALSEGCSNGSLTFFSAGTSLSLAAAFPLFGFRPPSIAVDQIVSFAIIVHNVGGF